jgi:hypothetical protein
MTSSIATAQESSPARSDHCTRVYWHRELPPVHAEIMGEHVLEASSDRVRSSLAHRDELWDSCYRSLLDNTHERFDQEICRLGGDYAHVLDESIDSRHDPVTGEAWLHGRFTYVLYRRGLSARAR